jgi:hypothetical protein
MLADSALGAKIIADLRQRSAPFHTTIEWTGKIGVVKVR